MAYSQGYPVRAVGGRLALDFLNTADWSSGGEVVHEKLISRADLDCWMDRLGLKNQPVLSGMDELRRYRGDLRTVMLTGESDARLPLPAGVDAATAAGLAEYPIEALIAFSAISILADRREVERLKLCPGSNCGWLFIDETKNRRRRWCSMETCGNRAKANRHYARSRKRIKTSRQS